MVQLYCGRICRYFFWFGVDTSLVFRSDYVLRGFDIDLRKRLTQQIKDRGVRIFPNNLINNIIKKENKYQVIISDNQTLESELVMGRQEKTQYR